ncbi:hypothetical protein LXD69_10005 [Flavobacterium sediminilitoris]|uniref:CD-NTase-associated protein 15 domain-containing protein n=1 Tax=Flavobacterium sediminilitoris TaxID=2024526 RepID=A0ABY4HHT0_9FLAO|nr:MULTISPECIES: hypothetical protein [Flavobacterium]UOX32385.1 hypothetical protein LXD69_10005 [Flavobacterium sediminilitoris]
MTLEKVKDSMEKDYFKYYKPNFLIYLIVGVFAIIYIVKEKYLLSISVLSILSFFIIIITKYLWNKNPFKFLFWIDDFSGRYEGNLIYSYVDEKGASHSGELKHVKIISQSGSKITVYSFSIKPDGTKSSLSVNKGMFVEKTDDEKHFRLIYTYLNDGSLEQGFPPHYGTEIIKVLNKNGVKTLEGEYYTNRHPYQTRGSFKDMVWKSNDNEHEF